MINLIRDKATVTTSNGAPHDEWLFGHRVTRGQPTLGYKNRDSLRIFIEIRLTVNHPPSIYTISHTQKLLLPVIVFLS